jgi:glc operon protein GlcG
MRTKQVLTLDDAKRVAAAAQAEADRNAWPVVIAIVDEAGHLLYFQRDQAQLGSIEVAIQKAKAAALFKRPTKFWEDLVREGKQSYLVMPGMLPIEGGLPLMLDGVCLGAIGVSGVTSFEDGQIAAAGLKALI